jgi:hypothetical protein
MQWPKKKKKTNGHIDWIWVATNWKPLVENLGRNATIEKEWRKKKVNRLIQFWSPLIKKKVGQFD